ncbi:formylglycine-generating enzyme family protein [Candidatus Thiothrix anitrata]|uniref:SUMF1/EgtB/PvdO family nonheme iron enzyme n=1 Tax=Candidatus Thiothrix anitrata TaxID=2823902 RepID=A0ABX7X711_9GAMM|nr:SUMF1/EgtB/PvdO family nonheme iron enzyme [Candidatus Thiothrix anitrata]QTR49754.1 SUMF1/EgtB/PvdO family nonheme iron enzyme [Candidatus Thiothrix anitrata]
MQRLLGDAVPLARIVAVLPPPVSPALLVRLLREFAPHLPLTRLQRLYALPNTQSDASGLYWGVDVLRLLRGQFHQWCRGEEKQRVQARLLGWYRAAKPDNEGCLRYYAWYWRYLRLLLEFSPRQAIPAMEQLQVSVAPLQAQIEQELQQDALPFPLPDADDEESRKRLMRISKGKVISEDVVWPALRSRKREVAGGLLLTAMLVGVAIWQSLPQTKKPIEIVVAGPVKEKPPVEPVVVELVQKETPPSLPLSGEGLKAALPAMVKIPGGTFEMGCVENKDCQDNEEPVHTVNVPAFEMGAYEVTFGQFRAFVDATQYQTTAEKEGSCWSYDASGSGSDVRGNSWRKTGYTQTDDSPVTCVSWQDAQAYLKWLSEQTKQAWRLPSEAEWEYATRGGTKTAYSWGDQPPVCDTQAANGAQFDDCKEKAPLKVGSFKPNPLGLYDVHGNALEWVEDCWQGDYKYAPIDGSARQGCDADASRVLRGGSWGSKPRWLRSAFRLYLSPVNRYYSVGFRAARTINPLPFTDKGTADQLAQAPQQGQAFQAALPQTLTDTQKVPAPTMVQIPAGKFTMGCDPKRDDVEGGCFDSEKPAHEVNVPTFWLSETEVTVAQYMACVKAGACPEPEWQEKGSDYNIQTGKDDHYKKLGEALTGDNYPIVGVSWQNAQAYVQWLSKQTSKKYRLPTEAEWEYAARAGTDTAYSWGIASAKTMQIVVVTCVVTNSTILLR